jgi:dTDP-glucose pyrophosphorylase
MDPGAPLTTEQAGVADSGVKGMIPVGRPFMDYLLSGLADAGFTDICLITGPEHGSVRSYYDGLETRRVRISHAIQTEPRGTADAVATAELFAGQDGFLVINSDNYYPVNALRAARHLKGSGLIAFSARAMVQDGGVPPGRVAAFPRVEIGNAGFLSRLSLHEDAGVDGYTSMNCWRFGPGIFEACRGIVPSARGELELPDAVHYSIDRLGEHYRVIWSDDPVLDLSSRADIARVTRQLDGIAVSL